MKIHILDANSRPGNGDNIVVNCGKSMIFNPPQNMVYWDDGNVCSECLAIHRLSTSQKHTWCSIESTRAD